MVLKLIRTQIRLTRCVARSAFTLGAVAGTLGVIGLYALRRAVKERAAPAAPGA
jgi:hypothetical protein